MERTVIKNMSECSGCSACVNVCPMKAVSMKENSLGFKEPAIDPLKCIDCGLCSKIHSRQIYPEESVSIAAYAARKRSSAKDSASGGVADLLSERFHNAGGYVFGAVMDLDGRVYHAECAPGTLGEAVLERFKGSKYAQSDVKGVYSRIKELLQRSEKVLFIGTPCQVNALKSVVSDSNGLLTADIVCHGTPSVKMLQGYIRHLRSEFLGFELEDFTFRDKKLGWGKNGSAYFVSLRNGGDDVHHKLWESSESFFYYFGRGSLARESCYQCPFASASKRPGDITLGDYWGIEKQHPLFYADDGVSAIICNTEKGKKAIEGILNDCYYVESTAEKIAAGNAQLCKPVKNSDPEIREIFLNEGWSGVEKRFSKISFMKRHTSQLKALVPDWLKYKIKAKK